MNYGKLFILAPWRVLVLIQVGSLRSPSQAHATDNRTKNPKPSVAELCADPLAQATAFTLGGFLDL